MAQVDAAKHLVALQRQAAFTHLALGGFGVRHLNEILDSGVTPVANIVQYSLIDRRAERGGMLALAREKG